MSIGQTIKGLERTRLDPIPISYAELYPSLVENHLIAPIHLSSLRPLFPKWYDENAQCSYHDGNRRYSTENCTALKYKVQELIRAGTVAFDEDVDSPNVTTNPLPNHMGPKINAICEKEGFVVQKDVQRVITPMIDMFKALTLAKIIPVRKKEEKMKELEEENGCFCWYREIEFCRKIEGNMVAITQEGSSGNCQEEGTPKPLVIYYKRGHQTKTTPQPSAPKLVVKVPTPFHYQDDKAVFWRYGPLIIPVHADNTSNETVNDIIGVGGMTRSGRCYAPDLMGVG